MSVLVELTFWWERTNNKQVYKSRIKYKILVRIRESRIRGQRGRWGGYFRQSGQR